MDDADLRTLAWRTFDCDTCKELAGRRCLTLTTNLRTSPHKPRLDQARGWVARQPEVDGLTGRLLDIGADLEQTDAALARMTAERDDLRIELQRVNLEVTGLSEEVVRVNIDAELVRTELVAIKAQFGAHMAEPHYPAPTPNPPSPGLGVGAAVGGNSDPAPLENALGRPLGLRRTYWGPADVDKAIAVAKADIAAGRIPFLSFKLPHSWAAMAAGTGDTWVRGLATKLAALGAPVWVVFHHEPEGDGPIADWVAMQQRILPMVASTNVKVGICLTGYPQVRPLESGSQYTLDKVWPGDMAQFLAVDIYQRYGTTDAGLKWTPLDDFYGKVAAFAASKGVPWGTGETGVTDEAFAADPGCMADLFAKHQKHNAAFLCYFSSSLNSKGSWPLTGDKLDAFVNATA